jgi:hypothetical protein
LDGHVVAEHLSDRFPERLGSVDDEQHPLLDIKPAVDQIPRATMLVRPCSSIPSIIITARRRSASGRDISAHSASRVRSTNARDTDDFDVDRSPAAISSPTGSCARRYPRVETPASIRSNTTRPSWSRSAKCS